MQKKWILLILLILAVSLSACNKNSKDEVADTKKQYLSKENMLSTEGLIKVEGDGFTYYTDIVGQEPSTIVTINSTMDIYCKKGISLKEFENLNEDGVILGYKKQGVVVENVKVEEKKLRGVKAKFVTYTMDSENYVQFGGFTKTGMVIVTYIKVPGDPLNKTFEHIINTIY